MKNKYTGHYTNKITGKVYGYSNENDAKELSDDYSNLVLMSYDLF